MTSRTAQRIELQEQIVTLLKSDLEANSKEYAIETATVVTRRLSNYLPIAKLEQWANLLQSLENKRRPNPRKCAYCGRTGHMIYIPDGALPGKPGYFGPVYACNHRDCTGPDFYDMPQGELDAVETVPSS